METEYQQLLTTTNPDIIAVQMCNDIISGQRDIQEYIIYTREKFQAIREQRIDYERIATESKTFLKELCESLKCSEVECPPFDCGWCAIFGYLTCSSPRMLSNEDILDTKTVITNWVLEPHTEKEEIEVVESLEREFEASDRHPELHFAEYVRGMIRLASQSDRATLAVRDGGTQRVRNIGPAIAQFLRR